jgi:multiple sugar transport system substrate-binding protein
MDVTAYGNMFNDISIEGDYYGLPTRSTCWFLLYNKDVFDKAGIAYPGQMTWKEYRELALSLTQGKGKNKLYGGFWAPWLYNFGAIQRSSYLIDDDLSYTRESLELLNNFYNVDESHVSLKQMAIQEEEFDYRGYFEDGKIAMMPQGEWIINMLIEDQKNGLSNVNWDIAPMPVFEGQDPGITWGQYQFVSIAKESKYPEEAFDFIQFLCGEEGARIYGENGIIHAYRSDAIKQIYLDAVGKETASIFYEAKRVQEELPVPYYQEIVVAFKEVAKEYLLGNMTIEETMSELVKKRADIYHKDP